MGWIFGGAAVGFTCFMMGYIVRGKIDEEELNHNRGEMGLDEGCYGCKEVGLPCDPKCKFNSITDYEEVNEDEQSEENNNQED